MKDPNAVRSACIRALSALFGAAMFRCAVASRLTSEARDRRLSAREKLSIRIHNRICPQCSKFARHLELLGLYAKDEKHLPPLPTEAKRRLVEALRSDGTRS